MSAPSVAQPRFPAPSVAAAAAIPPPHVPATESTGVAESGLLQDVLYIQYMHATVVYNMYAYIYIYVCVYTILAIYNIYILYNNLFLHLDHLDLYLIFVRIYYRIYLCKRERGGGRDGERGRVVLLGQNLKSSRYPNDHPLNVLWIPMVKSVWCVQKQFFASETHSNLMVAKRGVHKKGKPVK